MSRKGDAERSTTLLKQLLEGMTSLSKQMKEQFETVKKDIHTVKKDIDTVKKDIEGVEKRIGKRIDELTTNLRGIEEIVNNKLSDDDNFVLKAKAYFRALLCAELQSGEETRVENKESETYKYHVLYIDASCPMVRARGQTNANSRAPEKRDAAGSAFHTSGATIVSSEHTGGSVKKPRMREMEFTSRKEGSSVTMSITESETDGVRAQEKTYAEASATASSQLVPASTSAGKGRSKSKRSHPQKVSKKQYPTKIIVRPCYPLLYSKLMDAAYKNGDLGKRCNRFIVSGAPGIGKSTAFGAGYLMYKMLDDIREGKLAEIRHILWTSSKGVSVVFHIDQAVIEDVFQKTNQELVVDVYTSYTGAVPKLACAESTFWIMDNKEHGPFDSAEGVVLLLPSCKRDNYQEMRKTNCKIWYLPVWDGGRHRRKGFPLEMKALCENCYVGPGDDADKVLERVKCIYDAAGPFPREWRKTLKRAVACRNEDLVMIKPKDWSMQFLEETVHFGVDAPSNRLFYPEVDRTTLQVTGKSIPASKHIEYEMIRASARHAFVRTLNRIITRAQLSGHVHWNHGKDFELAMVLYLDTCSRKIQYRKLHSGRDYNTPRTYEKLILPSYGEGEGEDEDANLLVPQLEFVNAFTTAPARTECFFHSRTTTEPVVDAYFVSRVHTASDGTTKITVFLLQMTLNTQHRIIPDKLKMLRKYISKCLKHNHPDTIIEFMYIFLTTQKRASQFNAANVNSDIKMEQYVAYADGFSNGIFESQDKRKEESGQERKGKRRRTMSHSSDDDDGVSEDIAGSSDGSDPCEEINDD